VRGADCIYAMVSVPEAKGAVLRRGNPKGESPKMDEATKTGVLEFIKKKSERGKGMNSLRDITKGCPSLDRREIKKAVTELINEGVLDYWSSGSTTYIVLAGFTPGSGETEE